MMAIVAIDPGDRCRVSLLRGTIYNRPTTDQQEASGHYGRDEDEDGGLLAGIQSIWMDDVWEVRGVLGIIICLELLEVVMVDLCVERDV